MDGEGGRNAAAAACCNPRHADMVSRAHMPRNAAGASAAVAGFVGVAAGGSCDPRQPDMANAAGAGAVGGEAAN